MWHWENNRVARKTKGKQAENKLGETKEKHKPDSCTAAKSRKQKAATRKQQAEGSAQKVEGRRQKESRIFILICQACRARCNTQKYC